MRSARARLGVSRGESERKSRSSRREGCGTRKVQVGVCHEGRGGAGRRSAGEVKAVGMASWVVPYGTAKVDSGASWGEVGIDSQRPHAIPE